MREGANELILFLKDLGENFFLHIITLKDLTFFIIWCFLDSILYLTITQDFCLSNNKKQKLKNKIVVHLQLKQLILSALLVFCINIFLKNSNVPLVEIFNSAGFDSDINPSDTLSWLLTFLYIPTLFKITKEFKKNQDHRKKYEDGGN